MYMSDFSVNNEVIHCREGLSTIIGSKEMNGKEYFLVRVNRISGETFYVPVDSANSIIRHIMNVEEADELLKLVKKIGKDFASPMKWSQPHTPSWATTGTPIRSTSGLTATSPPTML